MSVSRTALAERDKIAHRVRSARVEARAKHTDELGPSITALEQLDTNICTKLRMPVARVVRIRRAHDPAWQGVRTTPNEDR